jgi:cytochrome b561
MLKNTPKQYGSVAKFFHWGTSTLVIFMIFLGYFMHDFPASSIRSWINIHKLIGLLILTLTTLRLLWLCINTKPPLTRTMNPWIRLLSRSAHPLLYLCLLTMTLSGWLMATASGHIPHLFSLQLAMPGIQPSATLATWANKTHQYTVIVLITLLVLHVLAACYHHWIRKDRVLSRMLPGCGP